MAAAGDGKRSDSPGSPPSSASSRPPSPSRTNVDVDGHTLQLVNLDKILYPASGFTKSQIIDYYARIAPVLLPHLAGRPLTLVRYPNGVDAAHFFEKNRPKHAPEWVAAQPIPSGRAGTVNYVVCNDRATLVWLANLAALELHPLLARNDGPLGVDGLHHPTMVVFDLDPGPPADVLDAARIGLVIRDIVARSGLTCLAKTSGSKGLHLAVPLDGQATYDDTRTFSLALAGALAKRMPDRVTADMKREIRPGKVFIDWSQNNFSKTTVGVYSLRATPLPQVSTPVTWDEIDDALRDGDATQLRFTPDMVLDRVARLGDLHGAAATASGTGLPQLV